MNPSQKTGQTEMALPAWTAGRVNAITGE